MPMERMECSCLRPGGERLTAELIQDSGLPRGSRILDIGCGRGESMRLLREEYGYCCTGMDPEPAYVAAAREANPHCPVYQAAIGGAAPLPDLGLFDGVLAECVISLFPDTAAGLRTTADLLQKGGVLLFSDVYAKAEAPAEGNGLLRRVCTKQQLVSELEKAGFRLIRFRDCGNILKGMLGQLILDYGLEEAYRRLGISSCALKNARIGYYLAAAIRA